MPIYEYACPTCKAQFERLRSMEKGDAAACPDCGTSAARVLSLFATATSVDALSVGSAAVASGCCGGGCH